MKFKFPASEKVGNWVGGIIFIAAALPPVAILVGALVGIAIRTWEWAIKPVLGG